MDVHFTANARDDLLKIGDFIAQESPIRAISFIDELEEKCLSIADAPKAFSLVPRYEPMAFADVCMATISFSIA